MAKPVSNFRCTECGWTTLKWAGRCGECQQWGTVVETAEKTGISRSVAPSVVSGTGVARPITHVDTTAVAHWPTGINEFDRVLGGGIVPGSVILLSGEPGVGKSTLLLEVASKAAVAKSRVLYVSAEESVAQVRLRAERTGALQPELFIAAETDLATILGQIDAVKPDLVIIDSVQTVSSSLNDGQAGQPGQVREVASTLIRLAKDRNLPVLLVGHVTKDGTIAGPRLLEHLVDVVCQFEGDRHTALRFVRALKNRFGSTDEVGCFEMTGDGISEVADPSGLFLSRGTAAVSGTCVTVAMEGRRALPVEVQALVIDTAMPNPRRVTNGVDGSRVAMLLAVLEKRAGYPLSKKDVYVSTVGGVRLVEPAADLAIAIAVASALKDEPIAHTVVAFGEISLAGEIRPVSAAKQRAAEAARMGFSTRIDASSSTVQTAVNRALGTGVSRRDAELDDAFR
ncbi:MULTISPECIES: DNA repair protein RadA [unclassified Cryobacterium]|uniref:DNA repair protein RadA n=1 Tax=unclassified Cryobacterium TaxID=2649013 RepID=UPI00106A7C42|nr:MULTISPECIES: DNA repair protein RadA [unclassified Cryobacterium]TFC52717.1 DNA repair protein RadA [Cryobacterium sp. TMB3-1-2]TFC60243.1 DNA repair protein RadA [Cryobacterium sp. TMB1-7]TFC68336.1 DNA repair protein RadA [Cryobacterium sp. TMB3-15]TFC74963.1 DNA repair protein RadA [Cryobacterium sp. TMB3-10]TFC92862.1 DNA repair protein RadA [Cryobacterium sp. TMT4-31]